jgi:hypothetical protein
LKGKNLFLNHLLNQAASDEAIALAYFSIPIWLAFSARARRIAMRANGQVWILLLFGAFILSCGFGHEIDAYYELYGTCAALSPLKMYWNWQTATLSTTTAVLVVPRSLAYMTAFNSTVDFVALQSRIAELEKEIEKYGAR